MVTPTPTAPASLPTDWTVVIRHLEAAYPNEGCGVIYRTREGGFRIVPLTNAADRYHALDPVHHPRTARTTYLFEPKEWLKLEQAAEDQGDVLHCIFHSHADVGAYFSAEDKAQAAPDDQPLYPGVLYLVVAVDAGKVSGAKLFAWKDGGWAESPVAGLPVRM